MKQQTQEVENRMENVENPGHIKVTISQTGGVSEESQSVLG